MYVIKTAADLPQNVDRWRIYHLLYDPGAGAGLYYSPDAINLVRLASGGATIPAGTVDNSILRWDAGGGVWVEFTSFILPLADGALDQIMQTDGAGTVTWVDIPAGVTPGTVVSSTLRWDGADWVENTGVRTLAGLIFGGTVAGTVLTLSGSSGSPDKGRVESESPMEILYDTFSNTTPGEQYAMRWRPAVAINASYIGGFLNTAAVFDVATALFIPAIFSDSNLYNIGLAPGFSAVTFINELSIIRNDGNFNLPSALVINVGLQHHRETAGTSTTPGTTGVSFAPLTRTSISGAVLTKTNQTAVSCAPTFSTVAGSTANLGAIRGLWYRNPAVGIFQPGAGAETATALYAVDVDILGFGGNIPKAALRSNIAAASNARFLNNIGTAQSEFGNGDWHLNDNNYAMFGNTLANPDIIHGWASAQSAMVWSTFFGVGGNPLYLEPNAQDEWIWRHASTGTQDIGMQFDVNAISFGTTAATPHSNNWFAIYSAPSLRTPNVPGEYSDILYSAGGALDIDGLAMSEVASLKVNSLAILLNGGTIADLANVRIEGMASFGATLVHSLQMTGRFTLDGAISYGSESPAQLLANTNDWSLAPNNAMRTIVLMDSDGAYNITGIVSSFGFAQDGDQRTIINTSAFTMTFTNEDVLSVAANRFQNANSGPITIAPQGSVTYRYEGGVSRWQQLYLTGTYLEEADADVLYLRLDTTNDPLTNNLDGPSFNSVPLTNAGAATNYLNEAGAYSLPPDTGQVDSVGGGTNINVTGTAVDPIVNLDAAIVGVSVNGVTLSNAGAATSYLDETGAYSVPPSIVAGTVTNATLRWSGSAWVEITGVRHRSAGAVFVDIEGSGAFLQLWTTGAAVDEKRTYIKMDNFAGFAIQSVTDGGSNGPFLMGANRTGTAWQELDVQTDLRIFLGNLSTEGGVFFMEERSAADAFVADYGQFWVRDDVPNVPMFTDDTGVDYNLLEVQGGSSIIAAYRFQTSIVEADPGSGNLRYDNATPASVTELFISATTDNGVDLQNILSFISAGDRVYFQQDNDASKYILFDVSANVDNTGWFSLAGTVSNSGTIPDSNAKCHILILFGASASGVASVSGGTNINVSGTAADPIVNLDAAILGVSVNGVTLSNAGAATAYLDETGAYSVPAGSGIVDSVSGGTNINVSGTGADPIVNLDAAILGVSVNGVTLSTAGAATSYLDETGAYSVPAGGGQVDSVSGGTNINVTGTGVDPIVNLDAAITGVSVNGVTLSNAGAATDYLDETGNYSTPPDTTGITQLTGDVTAGPGSGSQVATIPANTVANSQLADMAANTVKSRSAGSGDPQDLAIPANTVLGAQGAGLLAAQVVTAQITNDNVTYAKIQNVVSDDRILGNIAGAGGIVAELTGLQANTILPNFTSTLDGLAPLSGGGTTNFLRADGTWAAPPDTIPEIGGAITNNQIAFGAVTANDIEGEAGLTWDGSTLFTDGNFEVQNTAPYIELRDTNASVNEKVYRWRADAGTLFLTGYTDADAIAFNVFQIFRTGSVITEIDIQGQTVDIVGNLECSQVIYEVERVAAAANVPTQGQWWVRNDATQTPMFTADDGTSFALNASGGFTPPIVLLDNEQIQFGTGTDITMDWDGVDFEVESLASSQIWNWRDGLRHRFYDPTDAQYLEIDPVSATVFNINLSNSSAGLLFNNANFYRFDASVQGDGLISDGSIASAITMEVAGLERASWSCFPTSLTLSLLQTSGHIYSIIRGINTIWSIQETGGMTIYENGAVDTDFVNILHDGANAIFSTNAGALVMADHVELGDAIELRFGNTAGGDAVFDWNNAVSEFRLNLAGATDEFEIRFNGTQGFKSIGGGATFLGYGGVYPFQTLEYFGTGNTSGAQILAHSGHGLDVGFNVIRKFNDNVSDTLEASHCGQMAFKDSSTARTLTLASNVDLDFPVDGMTTVVNAFTSGLYTVTEGASTTLYVLDGTTRVDSAGGITIDPGGVVNVWRESATVYYCWGSGINP
jgi:hypothetical protein